MADIPNCMSYDWVNLNRRKVSAESKSKFFVDIMYYSTQFFFKSKFGYWSLLLLLTIYVICIHLLYK